PPWSTTGSAWAKVCLRSEMLSHRAALTLRSHASSEALASGCRLSYSRMVRGLMICIADPGDADHCCHYGNSVARCQERPCSAAHGETIRGGTVCRWVTPAGAVGCPRRGSRAGACSARQQMALRLWNVTKDVKPTASTRFVPRALPGLRAAVRHP